MIIHADVLTVDPEIVAGCDVMITDPPFSEHVHRNATSTRTGGVGPRERDFGFGHLRPDLRSYIALCASVLPRWSIVFSDLEGTHLWREAMAAAGVEYVRETPWDRWSQPQISGDRPPQGAEAVLQFHPPTDIDTIDPCAVLAFYAMTPQGPRGAAPKPRAKHWNGPGSLTCYRSTCLRGVDKHPAEKPLDLMLDLVSSFSDPGEAVFDPCAGRGTTGMACRVLGREHVGIEQDAAWACDAELREACEVMSRDLARVSVWIDRVHAEASRVPEPRADHERPTWERARRRLADVDRAREFVAAHTRVKKH